jgi:hypothetical protein
VPPVPNAAVKRTLSALTVGLRWVWWRILTGQPRPTPAAPQPHRPKLQPITIKPRQPPTMNKR